MTANEARELLAQPSCEVKDIQKIFGLSKNSAYQAIRNGEIEAIRIGGRIKIPTAPLRRRLGLDAEER